MDCVYYNEATNLCSRGYICSGDTPCIDIAIDVEDEEEETNGIVTVG